MKKILKLSSIICTKYEMKQFENGQQQYVI